MFKAIVFYLISSKFFCRRFFRNLIFFFPYTQQKSPCLLFFFNFLDFITGFLDLKNFKNRPKTLKKHLFSLQIDEKNNIFNFSIYSKKFPYL